MRQGGSLANFGKRSNQCINSFFSVFIIKGISATVNHFLVCCESKQVIQADIQIETIVRDKTVDFLFFGISSSSIKISQSGS